MLTAKVTTFVAQENVQHSHLVISEVAEHAGNLDKLLCMSHNTYSNRQIIAFKWDGIDADNSKIPFLLRDYIELATDLGNGKFTVADIYKKCLAPMARKAKSLRLFMQAVEVANLVLKEKLGIK